MEYDCNLAFPRRGARRRPRAGARRRPRRERDVGRQRGRGQGVIGRRRLRHERRRLGRRDGGADAALRRRGARDRPPALLNRASTVRAPGPPPASVARLLERGVAPLDGARRRLFGLLRRSELAIAVVARPDRRIATLAAVNALGAFTMAGLLRRARCSCSGPSCSASCTSRPTCATSCCGAGCRRGGAASSGRPAPRSWGCGAPRSSLALAAALPPRRARIARRLARRARSSPARSRRARGGASRWPPPPPWRCRRRRCRAARLPARPRARAQPGRARAVARALPPAGCARSPGRSASCWPGPRPRERGDDLAHPARRLAGRLRAAPLPGERLARSRAADPPRGRAHRMLCVLAVRPLRGLAAAHPQKITRASGQPPSACPRASLRRDFPGTRARPPALVAALVLLGRPSARRARHAQPGARSPPSTGTWSSRCSRTLLSAATSAGAPRRRARSGPGARAGGPRRARDRRAAGRAMSRASPIRWWAAWARAFAFTLLIELARRPHRCSARRSGHEAAAPRSCGRRQPRESPGGVVHLPRARDRRHGATGPSRSLGRCCSSRRLLLRAARAAPATHAIAASAPANGASLGLGLPCAPRPAGKGAAERRSAGSGATPPRTAPLRAGSSGATPPSPTAWVFVSRSADGPPRYDSRDVWSRAPSVPPQQPPQYLRNRRLLPPQPPPYYPRSRRSVRSQACRRS